MSNGNLLLSHRYFFLQTASQATEEKLKHNSFCYIHLLFVLFGEKLKGGGIGTLFISFPFVRSFSQPPTCL
jgi:hypothetical protein